MSDGDSDDAVPGGTAVEEARHVSPTGMADAPAAKQRDVDVEDMSVFRLRVKFTEAVFDHVLGLPTAHMPTAFNAELRKWERRHSKPVVHDCMCLLLCSRFGLTGHELRALLHLTPSQWVTMRASLSPYLKGTNVGKRGDPDSMRVRFFFEKVYDPKLKTSIYSSNTDKTAKLAALIAESDERKRSANGEEAKDAPASKAATAFSMGSPTAAAARKKKKRRVNAASLAMRIAGLAAKLANRRRKLTRVHEWPPVKPAVMRYYHVALGAFFAARASGLSVDAASLSILTGTAALPKKLKKDEAMTARSSRPGATARSTRRTSRPAGARKSDTSLEASLQATAVEADDEDDADDEAKTARSGITSSTWTTARRSLWAKLKQNVRLSREIKKYYMLRVKQASKHLNSLFGQKIKRLASALPRRYRTESGEVGEGVRIGRWVSRGDEGMTSGLRFVSYHLLQANRRKAALSVLLDLQYVEAMAASGYVYELIDCLCHLQSTSDHLCKTLTSKVKELTMEAAAARGEAPAVDDTPATSSLATGTGGGATPKAGTPGFLALVESEGFELLSIKDKLKHALHRRRCVTELLEFVRAEVMTLSRFPSTTFQLAAARPDSNLISQATKLHRAKGKERRAYLRWVNKPQYRDPCVLVLPGIDSAVLDIDYAQPAGATLCTGTADGHVVLWDIQTGTVKEMMRQPQPPPPDATELIEAHVAKYTQEAIEEAGGKISEDEERVIRLRATREIRIQLPPPVSVTKVRFHPLDPRYVVAGDSKGRIFQWDTQTQTCRSLVLPDTVPEDDKDHPPVHEAAVTALEWDNAGRLLASGDASGVVCLWHFGSDDAWNLEAEHGSSSIPELWHTWKAQERGVQCLQFGHPEWRPELELSASGPPQHKAYRSPSRPLSALGNKESEEDASASHKRLSSLVMHDTRRRSSGGHRSNGDGGAGVLGGLASLSATGGSSRSAGSRTYLVLGTTSPYDSDPGALQRPGTASSAGSLARREGRSTDRPGTTASAASSPSALRGTLSGHGVSYGSFSGLKRHLAEAEQRRKPNVTSVRVSPVVMGNHTHAMFPHGNHAALMCSLPPRLRKKTKKVWKAPAMKPSIVKALRRGSPSTADRDAVVAAEHQPWTMKTTRLGDGVSFARRGKMLRTSASAPALAHWDKRAKRVMSPAVSPNPVADWDVSFSALSDEEDSSSDEDDFRDHDFLRHTATNYKLQARYDDDADAGSVNGDEPNECGALMEGDILLLTSGASTMYAWRLRAPERGETRDDVEEELSASKVGQSVGQALAIRATARGVTGVMRRSNSIVKCVASTGERVTLSEAEGGLMLGCCFSPSRDRVAAIMEDKSVRVYVGATGKRVGVMDGHRFGVTSCAWAPDGYHLATGSVSGEIRVWLPHIIAKVGPQPQHQAPVTSIHMTSYETEGKMATVAADGDVKFWRMSDGGLFAHEEAHKSGVVQAVSFNGRGVYERCNVITTGGMRRWIPEIGAPGALPARDLGLADNCRVWDTSSIGDLFAFCNLDGLGGLQVVNTLTHKERTHFATKQCNMVRLIRFSPDCRLLLVALPAGVVHVYDLAQARHVAVGVKQSTVGSSAHLGDPTHALVDRKPMAVLEDIYRQSVQELTFAPDGVNLIWVSVETPVIKLWKVMAAIDAYGHEDPMAKYKVNIITRLSGHDTIGSMNITEACWDATGQRVASAGYDGSLRIWDANNGRNLITVRNAHDGKVVDHVVWCQTNERIITSGGDRTVRVWNPHTGIVRCLWLLPPPSVVRCISVNALGHKIVIGDQRGGVAILMLEGIRLGGRVKDTYVPPVVNRNVPRSVGGKKGGSGTEALMASSASGSPSKPPRPDGTAAPATARPGTPLAGAGAGSDGSGAGAGSDGDPESKHASPGGDATAAAISADDEEEDLSGGRGAASDSMSTWTSVPIVTMARLYYNEKHLWHSKLTVPCAYCSQRFNVFLQMVKIVNDVQQKMALEGPRPSFFKDPRLVMRCLNCKQPHRLNPFILDNPLGLK